MKILFCKLLLLMTILVLSTGVVLGQLGLIRKDYRISIPEKPHKLVLDPLPAGTYSVGTGGYFATIQSALNKLGTDGIAGEVVLELTDNLYTSPTDDFGFRLNGPIPGAGANSRVTIKPAHNRNVVLEGNGFRVMTFINTSYLTLDGVGFTGTTTLTFHALYNASYDWNDCVNLLYDSDHNIVKNITFISDDFYRYGAGLWVLASSTAAPDSNLIFNNFIKKGGAPYIGSDFASSRPEGNVIRGNTIGSETDSLINWGIQVSTCRNSIIENNIIQNLKIMNTVPGGEQLILGINSYSGLGDIIRNNVVHNIKAPGGYTAVGILLSGGSGSNCMVYNNMVYNIQSASTQSNSRVTGIQIWNQTNPKIYYNTVYLSGTGANHAGSAAFYVYGGFSPSTGVDLRNNIFMNTRDESTYCASAIYDYTLGNLTSDYNDLYYTPGQYNCLVRAGGTDYTTLPQWQGTGRDVHSVTEIPSFVAPYLHISTTVPSALESGGTPITGMTTDFDGQTRNATTPDIGADEFDGIVGVEEEPALPTEFALEQNYPNPFNPSTNIKYQIPSTNHVTLKVFDILGRGVAMLVNEVKAPGTYTVQWDAGNMASGVYLYRLQAGGFGDVKKVILLK